MAVITLDFETFFRSKRNKNTPGQIYSLAGQKGLTYEEYLNHPEFKVQGVAIKIDSAPTYYIYKDIANHLAKIFPVGNTHIMICHNTMFDGAILSWHYKLEAGTYYCTQSMSQALWAQGSHSLANLLIRLFPDSKSKRKSEGLEISDGVYDLSDEQQKVLGSYACNDVDQTFNAFGAMYPFYPASELEVLNTTLRMFIHPLFHVDRPRIIEYQNTIEQKRNELIENCPISETYLRKVHPRSTPADAKRAILKSSKQFAAYLTDELNITVPLKHSPTRINPDNITPALAKGDVEFLVLQAAHPKLRPLWDARLAMTSSGELQRCKRVLAHSEITPNNPLGRIAVPLKYCGAHTKRFSGTNKVNFQNFKRKSPIRLSLLAPPGHKVLVRDLANIEGRVNSWFNGHTEKNALFRNNIDVYNVLASSIYGYPVDRKALKTDSNGIIVDKHGNPCKKDADGNWLDAVEIFELEGRVGKVAELGLGYQMGAAKFLVQLYLAGVDADMGFASRVVNTWRSTNAPIVSGWKQAERVIFDMARKDLIPYDWGPIRVEKERLRLPDGLYLTYPGLRQTDDGQGFEYWEGKYWKSLYGGLLIENIIQALSRIIMTDMMNRIVTEISPTGGRIVLTVHDELAGISPDKEAEQHMAVMKHEMSIPPPWCADGELALSSSGGIAQNYSK